MLDYNALQIITIHYIENTKSFSKKLMTYDQSPPCHNDRIIIFSQWFVIHVSHSKISSAEDLQGGLLVVKRHNYSHWGN